MWMPHSDGMYSPLDFPESSMSDLFGSLSLASMMSVEGIARARTGDDLSETSLAYVHVDLDGMVTTIHLGSNGTVTLLVDFLACTLIVTLSCSRTISGQVQEHVAWHTCRLQVRMTLGSHQPALRVLSCIHRPPMLGIEM
jgi:hypothetical protein